MRSYSLVGGHQRFGGSCCLHLGDKNGPASEGCMFSRNTGSHLLGHNLKVTTRGFVAANA